MIMIIDERNTQSCIAYVQIQILKIDHICSSSNITNPMFILCNRKSNNRLSQQGAQQHMVNYGSNKTEARVIYMQMYQ